MGEGRTPGGGHTIQHKRTCEGNKGRQWREDPWEGRHTIQHRHACAETMETMGDKGGKASGRRTHTTKGNNKGRKKPSGTWTHHPAQAHMWGDNGKQGDARPPEGACRIKHRHTCGKTIRDNGGQWEARGSKTSGRRPNHPTKVNRRQQRQTRGDKTWGRRAHGSIKNPNSTLFWEQKGAQWEAKGDKTLGKADTPSNKMPSTIQGSEIE